MDALYYRWPCPGGCSVSVSAHEPPLTSDLWCFVSLLPPKGVALLPFVDERRLRAALAEVYPDLTPDEGESSTPYGMW